MQKILKTIFPNILKEIGEFLKSQVDVLLAQVKQTLKSKFTSSSNRELATTAISLLQSTLLKAVNSFEEKNASSLTGIKKFLFKLVKKPILNEINQLDDKYTDTVVAFLDAQTGDDKIDKLIDTIDGKVDAIINKVFEGA